MINRHRQPVRWLMIWLGALLLAACEGDAPNNDSGIPRGATAVRVVANSGLTPWLIPAVETFNAQGNETSTGEPVFVLLETVEAGQAVVDLSSGALTADVWIPDEAVWVDLLADQGVDRYQADCQSVAHSPLVIAMWRPIAESLGWPGRSLGWLDVGSLAADPTAWAYYSGGQFGPTLRLGHTHPGLSGTGASTLLALVQAAESKQAAVTVADIQKPIVQASVGTFESAVSWFSPSTATLGQTMQARGASYLGAAILYESTVQAYGGDDLVAIYPFEGTFMAHHPACLDAQASPAVREGATLWRDYLLSEAGQAPAAEVGLRPATETAAPPDLTLFAPPSVETVYAVQELWQAARKPINLVMLLDVSGSMEGVKMETMRAAAINFVQQMGDEDRLTIISFADQPQLVVNHARLSETRPAIVQAIETLQANGNTTLYDALGEAGRQISRTHSSASSNAIVLLTDGEDTASVFYPSVTPELLATVTANDTTVFTIAYGDDAEERLLADLAQQANGNFYRGDTASIALIYEEMSAAFGGSVGIGR